MAYFDDSPEVDVLAEASANTTCVNNNDETEKHLQEAHEMLSTLREENVQLKESLAQLTDKVQTLQQRETIMTSNVSKESEELRRRIHTLEKQLKEGGGAAPVHSGKGTGSSEEEMEKIKVLKAEVKRLNAKLKETREELRKRDMTGDVSVEQLKAELQLLANEVVPTKCKLAEYVAMADRIGIQYPFSDEMERCAVLRMKAMRPKSPPKKAHSNTTLRASTTEKNGKAANATPKKGTSSKKVKVRQAQEDAADAEDLR
uniref:Uncharacterized protein TCIL3000_9_180 n=1 Tax=Trypanosoma congolense (strain IL3000) TaxID=1068625 RepID=G0UTB1_TRYCI|nr:unnamed protein product [Trypanosoma congolense IL3000]